MTKRENIKSTLAIVAAVACIAFGYVAALKRIFPDRSANIAEAIDGPTVRDLVTELLQVRVEVLEDELAAREAELDAMATALAELRKHEPREGGR